MASTSLDVDKKQGTEGQLPVAEVRKETDQEERPNPELSAEAEEVTALVADGSAEKVEGKAAVKAATKAKKAPKAGDGKAKAAKPKEKLTRQEKQARKMALALAAARADMEARLYQIYQQLGVSPSLDSPLVLGITSSLRGEGRTTSAVGLATVLANTLPCPVLLLEADVSQQSNFVIEAEDEEAAPIVPDNTLCQYLRGETSLDDLAQESDIPDLWYIPAGDARNQALKVLRSNRLETLFEEVRQRFGVIVVDMPPMVLSAESGRVLGLVDKVFMVMEAGTTPRKLIKSNLAYIGDEKLGGILLNRTKAVGPGWLRRLFSF